MADQVRAHPGEKLSLETIWQRMNKNLPQPELDTFEADIFSRLRGPWKLVMKQFYTACFNSQSDLATCLADQKPSDLHLRVFGEDSLELVFSERTQALLVNTATLLKSNPTPPKVTEAAKQVSRIAYSISKCVADLLHKKYSTLIKAQALPLLVRRVLANCYALIAYLLSLHNNAHPLAVLSNQGDAELLKKLVVTGTRLSKGDLEQLKTALQTLQQESIPWRKYLERALLMALPFMAVLMLVDFFTDKESKYDSVTSLFFPALITLITSFIRSIHRMARINASLPYYISTTETWLKKAINHQQSHQVFSIDKLKLPALKDDWNEARFVLTFKEGLTKTQKKTPIILQDLFAEYNIRYDTFYQQGKSVECMQVSASDLYYLFSSRLGYEAATTEKFRNKFCQQIMIAEKTAALESILMHLKKNNHISAFYLDNSTASYNDYTVISGVNEFDVQVLQQYQQKKIDKVRQVIRINFTEIETFHKQSFRFRPVLIARTRPEAAAPQVSPKSANQKLKRRHQSGTDAAAAPETAAPLYNYSWNVNERPFTANDENVAMILSTMTQAHPSYVTYTFQEQDFNSLRAYDAAVEKLKYPRFAPKQKVQGLWLDGDTMTLKILGRNGKGDIRCRAERVQSGGAWLYVFNNVNSHDH